MDLLWICGKFFGAQVHSSDKWQANCGLQSHILQTEHRQSWHSTNCTIYQLLGCRYKQTMFYLTRVA